MYFCGSSGHQQWCPCDQQLQLLVPVTSLLVLHRWHVRHHAGHCIAVYCWHVTGVVLGNSGSLPVLKTGALCTVVTTTWR